MTVDDPNSPVQEETGQDSLEDFFDSNNDEIELPDEIEEEEDSEENPKSPQEVLLDEFKDGPYGYILSGESYPLNGKWDPAAIEALQ